MLSRIRKDDLVEVISGKDKGKQGNVIAIDRKADRVRIRGVAIRTKHVKPKSAGSKGKIEKQESFVSACKVMPVCPETGKPCRVRVKRTDDGGKVRISHRSGTKI
ncbi:50S ribosomal protein L24 [Candidatus Babeliales bacterium]|nr:50S ribosomal protein L24 [Candidatus Babeliales bacterium]